ncbi:hypothetical protein BJ742DRAFT_790640 [Cladochytrium replicatum]|nr:hypothetical protein BJ742DRAFT_790640 [Cladochytrium replicatum]
MLLPIINDSQQLNPGSHLSQNRASPSLPKPPGLDDSDYEDEDGGDEIAQSGLSKRLDALIKGLERLKTGASSTSDSNKIDNVLSQLTPKNPGPPIAVTNIDDYGGVEILPKHVVLELIRLGVENSQWPYNFLRMKYVTENFDVMPRAVLAALAAQSVHWFKDLAVPGPNGSTLIIPSAEIGRGFFEKAKKLMDFESPTISTVITLLCMFMYCKSTAQYRSAWMYKGLGHRLARLLCLHIDPDDLEKKMGKCWLFGQKEMRRKLWWGLIMTELPDGYETVLNCKVHRPLPSRLTRSLAEDVYDVPKEVIDQYPRDATSYAIGLNIMLAKITAYGDWVHSYKAKGIPPPEEQVFRDLLQEQLTMYETMPHWIKQSLSAPVLSADITSIDPPSYFAVFDHLLYHGNIILLNRHRISLNLSAADFDRDPATLLRNDSFTACYLAAVSIGSIVKSSLLTKTNITAFRSVSCIALPLLQSLFVHMMTIAISIQANERALFHNSKLALEQHIEFMKIVAFRWNMMKRVVPAVEWLIDGLLKQRKGSPPDSEFNSQPVDDQDRRQAVLTLKYMNNLGVTGREVAIAEQLATEKSMVPDPDIVDATEDVTAWFKSVFLVSSHSPNRTSSITVEDLQNSSPSLDTPPQATTLNANIQPTSFLKLHSMNGVPQPFGQQLNQSSYLEPAIQNLIGQQQDFLRNGGVSFAGQSSKTTGEVQDFLSASGLFSTSLLQFLEQSGANTRPSLEQLAQNPVTNYMLADEGETMSFLSTPSPPTGLDNNFGGPSTFNWEWKDPLPMTGVLGGPSVEVSNELRTQQGSQADIAMFEMLFGPTSNTS